MFRFELPIQSSSNTAYATAKNGARRVLSRQARESATDILIAIQPHLIANKRHCDMTIIERMRIGSNNPASILKAKRHDRPSYNVAYTFHFRDDTTPRDIANFEKLLTDILVEVGFMLDDQFIDKMTFERGEVMPDNPHVLVEISENKNILKK